MNRLSTVLALALSLGCLEAKAQFEDFGIDADANFDSIMTAADADFDAFTKEAEEDFEAFRKKCNEEYAEFLKSPWKAFEEQQPVPQPKEEPVPPVVYPKGDEPKPLDEPKPIPFDTIITAPPAPVQPQPVVPIKPLPTPPVKPQPVSPTDPQPVLPVREPQVDFRIFGTNLSARFDRTKSVSLNGVDERSVARAWERMSEGHYTNLIYDCLQMRERLQLCDWAYIKLIEQVAGGVAGTATNEATLLMAYIYCQSGYKMRLASDRTGRLHMLFASQYCIYDRSYFTVEGEQFYPYGDCPSNVYISSAKFRGEQSLSLQVKKTPRLDQNTTAKVIRQAKRYPEMKVEYTSNKNLLDFYSTYPTSMVGDNHLTRWAMYANTQMDEGIKKQIYPALKNAIRGCDELLAANKLINFVQTGFVYEYDNKVWGEDRAFFAEESLYYPYCDCEDRSVLFTRLIRDLLGLDCILIYYPGHLAAAVEFSPSTAVSGDYIMVNGRKFIVSDPTFIGAPIGRTMTDMDNRTAKVILLE